MLPGGVLLRRIGPSPSYSLPPSHTLPMPHSPPWMPCSLIRGLEIKVSEGGGEITVMCPISWFNINEKYPWNDTVKQSRRDMRKGEHTGRGLPPMSQKWEGREACPWRACDQLLASTSDSSGRARGG